MKIYSLEPKLRLIKFSLVFLASQPVFAEVFLLHALECAKLNPIMMSWHPVLKFVNYVPLQILTYWSPSFSSALLDFLLLLIILVGHESTLSHFILTQYGLQVLSFGPNLTEMSLSVSRVEWQPLVVQSVFIASLSSPRSVWLGNECNWSFWCQWRVGLLVACGKGFLRSVPHHSLLELVKPWRRDL